MPAIVIAFLILLFSLTVHEAAHAWTASRLGDDTARRLGRVSLNPIVHIDPIGTLLLPLIALASGSGFIFGWAKPTPVNVRNFQHPRRDNVLVTVAGPLSNLAIAIAAAIVLHSAHGITAVIALEALSLNVLLAIFNMLPIPPLDGANLLWRFLSPQQAWQWRPVLQQYGFIILLVIIITLRGPLSSVISNVANLLLGL